MTHAKERIEEEIMTTTRTFSVPRAERFIEEGQAFMELSGLAPSDGAPPTVRLRAPREGQRFDVIVIGGGQAGLSVGYHLAQRGLRFLILEANERIGDSWRKRWDSLHLFTPARFDGLDGMAFPAPPDSFPTKDEMASYLEGYAKHFQLPVRTSAKVDRLTRHENHYVVTLGDVELEADHVVVAMANYQVRRVPAFAQELASDTVQLHSSEYRNPSQLVPGDVLIAGAGNSGSEIAIELSKSRRVSMSGRDTGHIPFRIGGFWGRLFLVRLVLRVLFHRVMTLRTALGRKVRAKMLSQGGPLIRVKPRDLSDAGVERVPRVVGVKDGRPLLEDGRRLDVRNVVWCTGYDPGLSWIDLPIFGEHGEPVHEGGVVVSEPGLYFVGRLFLYAASSVMVHGVGRDAERIVREIAARKGQTTSPTRARNTVAVPSSV
jgi:putative flavoprotein involved in K+ transport